MNNNQQDYTYRSFNSDASPGDESDQKMVEALDLLKKTVGAETVIVLMETPCGCGKGETHTRMVGFGDGTPVEMAELVCNVMDKEPVLKLVFSKAVEAFITLRGFGK